MACRVCHGSVAISRVRGVPPLGRSDVSIGVDFLLTKPSTDNCGLLSLRTGDASGDAELDVRERGFFLSISRSMPTANAEDPRRSEGWPKDAVSAETFPTPTLRFDLAPRRSPSASAEKLL